ncbi:MAG: hypothetical protein QM698_02830 [Micropepsaceae bacterium]
MRLATAALVALLQTATAAAETAPPVTYEHAVECAAVTAVMLTAMRSVPEQDAAKIQLYDEANSAWIGKLAELAPDREPGDRMGDVIASQRPFNDDPDGATRAAPIAEACVAEVQPH